MSFSLTRAACYDLPTMCLALLLGLLLAAQTKHDPWLVVPGERVGPLTAHTRRSDLVRLVGARNVKDAVRGPGGDAEGEPATIIYPGKLDRELTIFWIWNIARPTHVAQDQTIDFVDLCSGQHRCKWHLENGLSLGSSLKQLEAWNGGVFDLYGFGWDYSGTVADWLGGRLSFLLDSWRHIGVALDLAEPVSPAQSADYHHLEGSSAIVSSDPAMQRLDPTVYEITVKLAKEHSQK